MFFKIHFNISADRIFFGVNAAFMSPLSPSRECVLIVKAPRGLLFAATPRGSEAGDTGDLVILPLSAMAALARQMTQNEEVDTQLSWWSPKPKPGLFNTYLLTKSPPAVLLPHNIVKAIQLVGDDDLCTDPSHSLSEHESLDRLVCPPLVTNLANDLRTAWDKRKAQASARRRSKAAIIDDDASTNRRFSVTRPGNETFLQVPTALQLGPCAKRSCHVNPM